jgi:hypothetical protein
MTTGIPDGLGVRRAAPADALEVYRLFGRCSPDTRYATLGPVETVREGGTVTARVRLA